MKPITPGCTAIIVRGFTKSNIGLIVKIGKFIGKHPKHAFIYDDLWETDKPLGTTKFPSTKKGKSYYCCSESVLERIDDENDENLDKDKSEEEEKCQTLQYHSD